ncbi:MAG: hypothetical protein IIA67_14560, partial [Planctomycetes bacterium]|nr:hypothetical protein [Planctomycetota bacterium]
MEVSAKPAGGSLLAGSPLSVGRLPDVSGRKVAQIEVRIRGSQDGSERSFVQQLLESGQVWVKSHFVVELDYLVLLDAGLLAKLVVLLVAVGRHVAKAVVATNQRQREIFFKKILSHFGGEQGLTGKTLAFWGLAFKPKTDDIRQAPALTIARKALGYGCTVRGFDPVAMENVAREAPTIDLFDDMYEAAKGADAL